MKVISQSKSGTRLPRTIFYILTGFLSIAFLFGCAVGPNYHRPPVAKPSDFRGEASTNTNSFGDLPWWEVFKDDALQKLVRTALTNNYNLQIAITRVEQARQVVKEARAGFYPQVNYLGLAGKGKNVGVNNSVSPTGTTGSEFGGDINAVWEIDIWGRIRRLSESARAQYLATKEAQRDVTAGLVAEVAQDYFQLLALDRELEIAKRTTNSFGESLQIFQKRLNGGVSSKLETSSAEALLASVAATIPQLQQRIFIQENQISILISQPPGEIPRGDSMFEGQLAPEVPAGLPSSLLERRPDVREVEQNLRSANAQVGVAEANFFPQLDLSALFGRVSPEVSALTAGSANAWGVAASLSGPIFQGGLLRAQYNQALAARQQAVLQYQATVLYALQEVSDSLISRQKSAEARVEQAHAVNSYQEAVKVALERYRLGQSSYYEVLQEQQLLFPAENTLVQTQLDQLTAMIQLYRALGGGWRIEPSDAKAK